MKFLVIGLGSMGKRRVRCLMSLGEKDIIGFDPRQDRCDQKSPSEDQAGRRTRSSTQRCEDEPDLARLPACADEPRFHVKSKRHWSSTTRQTRRTKLGARLLLVPPGMVMASPSSSNGTVDHRTSRSRIRHSTKINVEDKK